MLVKKYSTLLVKIEKASTGSARYYYLLLGVEHELRLKKKGGTFSFYGVLI